MTARHTGAQHRQAIINGGKVVGNHVAAGASAVGNYFAGLFVGNDDATMRKAKRLLKLEPVKPAAKPVKRSAKK